MAMGDLGVLGTFEKLSGEAGTGVLCRDMCLCGKPLRSLRQAHLPVAAGASSARGGFGV
jgi:hypothetical protein